MSAALRWPFCAWNAQHRPAWKPVLQLHHSQVPVVDLCPQPPRSRGHAEPCCGVKNSHEAASIVGPHTYMCWPGGRSCCDNHSTPST